MANWVIVGTGALSSLWAHGLQTMGANVMIYSRKEKLKQSESQKAGDVNSRDVNREVNNVSTTVTPNLYEPWAEANTSERIQNFPLIDSPADAPSGAVWLLIVKAWQLEPLLAELAAGGLDTATLILSHNGMGAGDAVIAANPHWQIYDLVTTHGAWRKNQTHSVHAGLGESWLGARKEEVAAPPTWFNELAQALPPLHWTHNILQRRWQKLAVNCAINPIATLAEADNGIVKADEYQPQIRAICEEIANVNPALDADELVVQVHRVAAATATNRCSMLQDTLAGRKTEIEFLNGFICREGKRKHVATRSNCELVTRIQALESGYK